jgi:hypothetical protein
MSVLLVGGDGKEVNGQWFAKMNQLVMDNKIKLAGSGQTIDWPLKAVINYPGTTITIPSITIEADVTERE